MKFQNRLASVLSSAMLALNCIGAQSAFAASNVLEKTGMTKLFSYSAEELNEEGKLFTIPEDDNSNRYYLYYEYVNLSALTISIDVTSNHREYVKDGNRYVEVRSIETETNTIEDKPGNLSGYRYQKLADANTDLISFRITLEEPTELPEGSSCSFAIYGYKKGDEPDPSLSEITGTTTGTAAVGEYDSYQPQETDENGNPLPRATNAYWGSNIEIRQYPKQHFALGEPFTTEGLKVILTERRSYNSRPHDISDCLQIRTDYDPDTPGEYVVYIRTDYKNGEGYNNDYLFYTVVVDSNLTVGPEVSDSTDSESRTTPDTTESETAAEETVVSDDTTLASTDTTVPETVELTDPETQVLTVLRGDVDCSGQVMIADAVLLARYVAEDAVKVTAQGLVNAELDGESGLTSGDLSALLQLLAGTGN